MNDDGEKDALKIMDTVGPHRGDAVVVARLAYYRAVGNYKEGRTSCLVAKVHLKASEDLAQPLCDSCS